jgi:iron complex outermembrane recepter protein
MTTARAAILAMVPLVLSVNVNAAAQSQSDATEEVVVTAGRRPLSLTATPVSVSAYESDVLQSAGIETIKSLAAIAPSLGVVNSIGESFGQLLRVRGVATSGADIGLESAAGITIDGVPIARPNLAIGDLQGVERIEFLKGPQGTLFGKNATAGVINVLTRRPSFVPGFAASATAGNFDARELRFTATGPLLDNRLAGRIDALYASKDGMVRTLSTGQSYGGMDRTEVRAQGLWAPSATFDLRVIANHLDHKGSTNAPAYRVVGPTGPVISSLSGTLLTARRDAEPITQIDAKTPRFQKNKSSGLSAEANWRSGGASLVTIASYGAAEFARDYDIDGSPADLIHDPQDGEAYRTFSAESRLRIQSGRWDHLLGAFLGREITTSRDSYTAGEDLEAYANALASGAISTVTGLPPGQNVPAGSGVLDVLHQRSTEAAAFVHEIVHITQDFSLTAGLRYTQVSKDLRATLTTRNPGCSAAVDAYGTALAGIPPAQTIVCVPNLDPRYDGSYATERTEGDWSGTAAILRQFSDNASAYVSYSRGYKVGGYQLDRSGMSATAPSLSQLGFGAEFADSYEAGAKGYFFNRALWASTDAFFTKFSDYQLSYFTGFNRRTQNIPELTTKGVELELGYRPLQDLELSAAATYQEVIFGDAVFPAGLDLLQGLTVPLAPRWTTVTTVRYGHAVPSIGVTTTAYFDMRWQSASSVGASPIASPDFRQGAYAVVGARLTVAQLDGPWSIEFWTRNLFDQRAWTILYSTTLQPSSISGYVLDSRSWGVTLAARW